MGQEPAPVRSPAAATPTPTSTNHAGLQPNYFKHRRDLPAEELPLKTASTDKPAITVAFKRKWRGRVHTTAEEWLVRSRRKIAFNPLAKISIILLK